MAFDQMLQEDFSHPITRYLSWYACHMLWKNPSPPVQEQNKPEEEEVLHVLCTCMWIEENLPEDLKSMKTIVLLLVYDYAHTVLGN